MISLSTNLLYLPISNGTLPFTRTLAFGFIGVCLSTHTYLSFLQEVYNVLSLRDRNSFLWVSKHHAKKVFECTSLLDLKFLQKLFFNLSISTMSSPVRMSPTYTISIANLSPLKILANIIWSSCPWIYPGGNFRLDNNFMLDEIWHEHMFISEDNPHFTS